MGMLYELYLLIDALLIYPFRFFANPVAGFFVGSLVLCIWSILLGEITLPLLVRVNRRHIQALNAKKIKMHNLSVRALLYRDKESYTACNRQANEAFGRYFFAMFGLSAASLWPAPFALGWLATRFHGVSLDMLVSFPFIGKTAGYTTVFIPLYILLRILWGRLKKRNGWGVDIAAVIQVPEKMLSLEEVRKTGRIPGENELQNTPP